MEAREVPKGMETTNPRPSMKERRPPRPAPQPHQDASRHFEKIVEMGNDGIFVFDEQCKIVFANQMASEITGIAREDLIGHDFFGVIGRQDKDFLEGAFTRGGTHGQKLCIETEMTTPQGQIKGAEVCLASAKSDEGDVKTYAYIRDITERRRFEKDLKNSEEKLRTLFERVRHGLFISSKEGRFLECNQALLDMLGYSSKRDLLRRDLPQDVYVQPEDRTRFMERAEREGCVRDMEVEFKKKNGEKITVLLTAYPIWNDRGEIAGYEGINLDITERKQIEEELRKTNEFFMNLIQSSVDGIIAADMKGNIFIFNKGAETLTGYKAEEVVGKIHITDIYPKEMAREVMKGLRGSEYGGTGKLTPRQLTVVNKA
ncbi:MAG: PAS domain S-box protein, partial [Deltaproteobacteria bacterium]